MIVADIFGIGALLQQLLDDFVCFIESGVVLFSNYMLKGISVVIGGLLSLLPDMPGLSTMPTWAVDGYNYVAYFFPVDYGFTLCATLLTLWISWVGIAIVFRWGRILGGKS